MDSQSQASAELPRYQCHKKVWALKIKAIELDPSPPRAAACSCILTPEDDGYAPFRVDEDYVRKHSPRAGGYYVVYEDGYKSYSPAAAFESGYTRI